VVTGVDPEEVVVNIGVDLDAVGIDRPKGAEVNAVAHDGDAGWVR
jgi:hypothetical protein